MSRIIERRLSDEAFAWVDALVLSKESETLSLLNAAGRVLAQDIVAAKDIPEQRMAATDGFAVRSSDTVGAADYSPLPLSLRPVASRLAQGECMAICSGETMPAGADAVLPLEIGDIRDVTLEVVQPLVAGDWVAESGEECRSGALLLAAGRCLRPQDLGLLALAGVDKLLVWRKPVVKIVLAGSYQCDADGTMLSSIVLRDGGHLAGVVAIPDGSALADVLADPASDLVLVAGGTGAAAADHALAALKQAGLLEIHRVAIHPGGNVALGRAGGAAVLLLPGTPLACFAAYDLIGARVLRRMARLPGIMPYKNCKLPLASKLTSSIGRLDLCRVRIQEGLVQPLAVADERKLITVVKADGFVIVPEQCEGYGRGMEVLVYLYD
jgi:molybdopterin molybdotransferase